MSKLNSGFLCGFRVSPACLTLDRVRTGTFWNKNEPVCVKSLAGAENQRVKLKITFTSRIFLANLGVSLKKVDSGFQYLTL